MIPASFPEANRVLAANQDDYEPIHVHAHLGLQGKVTCCFRLSETEIDEIVRTRTLWYSQLTFGEPFQPVMLSTQRPADM
jgi:hypothetical protein